MVTPSGAHSDSLAYIVVDLLKIGADVHVAQPDYRHFFRACAKCGEHLSSACSKFPAYRVHLAEDRHFFYAEERSFSQNGSKIKLSIAFQREVLNHVLPFVVPDLIHCHNWETGLIPSFANKVKLPCLFTISKLETCKTPLAYVEDVGIDAAFFWRHLYFDRFPASYEESRDTNPIDFLLSGVYFASHVATPDRFHLKEIAGGRNGVPMTPLRYVLANRSKHGCVTALDDRSFCTQDYIDVYERLLKRSILSGEAQPDDSSFEFISPQIPNNQPSVH